MPPALPVRVKDETKRGARRVVRSFEEILRKAKSTSAGVAGMNRSLGNIRGAAGVVSAVLSGPVGLIAGLGGLSIALRSASRDALEFGTAFHEVSTLLPEGSEDLEELRDAALGFSDVMRDAPVERMRAIYQIVSAGATSAAEATNILTTSNKLALGGVTDIATAADGLTSILNAYGMEAERAIDVSDAMFVAMRAGKTTIGELANQIGFVAPLAAQTNVQLEEILAATAALTKGGVDTAVAMRGLRQVIANVIRPSSEAAKAAAEMGLAFDAAALESKGLHRFMLDVQTATGGSAEKLSKLFGAVEALVPVMALTGKGAEDFAEILGDMGSKAGETEEALEKMLSDPQVQLDILMGNIKTGSIQLGENIVSALNPVLRMLNQIIAAENDILGVAPAGAGDATSDLRRRATIAAVHPMAGDASGQAMADALFEALMRERALERGRGTDMPGAVDEQRQFEELDRRNDERIANALKQRDEGLMRIITEPVEDFLSLLPMLPGDPDLSDLETPWVEGLKSVNNRMADMTIEREEERLGLMRAAGASEDALLAQGAKVEGLRLKQLVKLRETEYKALGLTAKEMEPLLEGERELSRIRMEAAQVGLDAVKVEKEEAEALEERQRALELSIQTMSQVNPQLAQFGSTMLSLARGDAIGAVFGGVSLAMDALSGMGEATNRFAENVARSIRNIRAGEQAAFDLTSNLFPEDQRARQEAVFEPLMELFEIIGRQKNLTGQAQQIENFLASLSQSGITNPSLRAVLEELGIQTSTFLMDVEAAFGPGSTLLDAGVALFETSDAFKELRDSAERATKSAKGLSQAEEDVIRARFRGEIIGAQSELGQRLQAAGGDTFMQRKAFLEFQKTLKAIKESMRLAVSRGDTSSAVDAGSPPTARLDSSGNIYGASPDTGPAKFEADDLIEFPSDVEVDALIKGFQHETRNKLSAAMAELDPVPYVLQPEDVVILGQELRFLMAGIGNPERLYGTNVVRLNTAPETMVPSDVVTIGMQLRRIIAGATTPPTLLGDQIVKVKPAPYLLTSGDVYTTTPYLRDLMDGNGTPDLFSSRDIADVTAEPRLINSGFVYTMTEFLRKRIDSDAPYETFSSRHIVDVDADPHILTTRDVYGLDQGLIMLRDGDEAPPHSIPVNNLVEVDTSERDEISLFEVFRPSPVLEMAMRGEINPMQIPVANLIGVDTSGPRRLVMEDVLYKWSEPLLFAKGGLLDGFSWRTLRTDTLFRVDTSNKVRLKMEDIIQMPTTGEIASGFGEDIVVGLRRGIMQALEESDRPPIPYENLFDFGSPEVIGRLTDAVAENLLDRRLGPLGS